MAISSGIALFDLPDSLTPLRGGLQDFQSEAYGAPATAPTEFAEFLREFC
jgi:hypothetical protein